MGFSVRGHICIRRKAKDGDPGEAGKSIRTTVWETGKQYYAGDTQVDGVYPLDIVADKAISIGVSGVNFYMCRTSHTSASNIPLTNTAYWTKLNNLKPVVTYLILAELIKANYIDVQDLAAATAFINSLVANTTFTEALAANTAFINKLIATSAFIDNLSVKHLNGADGTFTGGIRVPFVALADAGLTYMYRDSTSKPGTGGDFYFYHYQLKADSASYIDISQHVSYYEECVIIHIPNLAGLDGRRFAFTFPYRPFGYDLGGALGFVVPNGGAIHSDAIQLENEYSKTFVKRTTRGIANGGVVEILIQIKDNNPIVYITSGDVPDLYNMDYAPWSV